MPKPAYQIFFDAIVEQKDLHSEDGETVLALIAKVYSIAHMIPPDSIRTKFAIEFEIIDEIISRLPDRLTEKCIQCNEFIKDLKGAIYGELNHSEEIKQYGFICPKCFIVVGAEQEEKRRGGA